MIAVRRIRQISALLRPPSGVGYRTFSHQGLAPSPQTVQIAAAEREAYQRDGVVHLPGAFSEDWVTYLREAFQQGMEKPGRDGKAEGMLSGQHSLTKEVWVFSPALPPTRDFRAFGSRRGSMVEGDGCHRIAAEHRRALLGRKMTAKSPNGKFKAGAQAINSSGGVLTRIEVHGKNMFYFFGQGAKMIVVHIHFGIGNIYRTEILYEAALHPKQPANTLTQQEILKVWNVAVKQMQAGFKTGSIWGHKKGAFCYGKKTSACGGKVKQFNMGGRSVYACSKRQRLDSKRAPLSDNKALPTRQRRSGTKHLGRSVSAVEAENKKRKTGEGLAVQHVALKDDATRRAALAARAAKKRPAARKGPKPVQNDVQMFQDQVFYAEATERVPAWQPLLHSHAAQLIAELMGSAAVSFFYLHAILKRGGCEQAIPWHQDLPYWKVDGRQIGSVWIALDDMPLAASVRYVQGSHAWGLFRPQHFVDHSSYTGREDLPLLPDVDGLLQTGRANALAFEVKAGDALCFDARIVHGSLGNPEVVQEHRRIALRFGGDDATYCDREGETAIPTPEIDATHGLRHGDALTCEAFPRVWP
eukprot:g12104.t1